MALKVNNFLFEKTRIVLPEVYVRIDGVAVNIDSKALVIMVLVYSCEEARHNEKMCAFERLKFEANILDQALENDERNIMNIAYDYLKKLDEFENAVDV